MWTGTGHNTPKTQKRSGQLHPPQIPTATLQDCYDFRPRLCCEHHSASSHDLRRVAEGNHLTLINSRTRPAKHPLRSKNIHIRSTRGSLLAASEALKGSPRLRLFSQTSQCKRHRRVESSGNRVEEKCISGLFPGKPGDCCTTPSVRLVSPTKKKE